MDIFISYSHLDTPAAEKLYKLLIDDKKWNVWMDAPRIPNGAYWRGEIDLNLSDAPLVIVLVSSNSMQSPYVTYEWCYKWFRWMKYLNDLFFIGLEDLDISNEGMFGRIRADLQTRPKIIRRDEDWNTVIAEIDERLNGLKEMQRQRDILIDRTQREQPVFDAIKYLGQVRYFRRKACEFLIQGMEAQYTGMGTVVAAIADALSRAGDYRALPCLSVVKDKTTDGDAIRKAQNAMEQILRRLDVMD